MNPTQAVNEVERDLLDALQPDEYTPDQPESWQPNTIDEVDWAAQKAAQADAEYQQAVAAAKRQMDKIQAWLADAKSKRDDRVGFFEMHAVNYLQRVRQDELERGVKPEKLTKSIKLSSGGRVQSRQLQDTFNVEDEAAAIEWARANDAEQLLNIKTSIAKRELAKFVKTEGALPDGVTVEPGEIKMSLSLPEVAS